MDRFPPHFTPKKDHAGDNDRDFRESGRIPDGSYPSENNEMESEEGENDGRSVLSGIGQNTVVLIGALLLLLNFLCFLGLFYQRERLKKTELQLRRRFMDGRQQNPEISQEMETASSFERGIPIHTGNHIPHGGTPARDAMSETETENGFGPDFLGPNYDPRTKVNRWMNMQNANRAMLSKDNSFDNPSPSISDFHVMNRRETDLPDPSISVLPLPPPLQPSSLPHHLHPHHPHHPPLHIQVTSLQRHSQQMPKMMPLYDYPPPVQILPPLPYQEPFQPSASLVSDIPYADSRNTSPLTIPQHGSGYPHSPTVFLTRPDSKAGHRSPIPLGAPSTNVREDKNPPEPQLPPQKTPLSVPHPEQEKNPSKRTSVVIVRDLDPIANDLDTSEPKLVPVKTGTLKRSVGVDTSHDGSPAKKEGGGENHTAGKKERGSSQIRVTFSEKV